MAKQYNKQSNMNNSTNCGGSSYSSSAENYATDCGGGCSGCGCSTKGKKK